MMRTLIAVLLALALVPVAGADYSAHPRSTVLLELLDKEYGFTAADLAGVRATLRSAQRNPQLVEAEQTAKEKTLTWSQYRPIHVHERNIAAGDRFLREHARWLALAEREYGVPPRVIAAILGVETKYGNFTGVHRVLDSLATQGFDHPTRHDYFLRELAEFLVLCREHSLDPLTVKGSYAGAMGLAQFMPSNYRRLAVDFNGDGRKNLWDPADAIGSIGNYLINYAPDAAWRRGEPIALPARLDGAPTDLVPRNGRSITHHVGDFARVGIRPSVPLPPLMPAGLVELPLDDGQEYWLALPNFYGIMKYNPRTFYAMAVTQLAAALQMPETP